MNCFIFNSGIGGTLVMTPVVNIKRTLLPLEEFRNSRSPIDPDESDFYHVKSSWYGLKLNIEAHPISSSGVKFKLPNSTFAYAKSLAIDGTATIMTTTVDLSSLLHKRAGFTINTMGIDTALGYGVAKSVNLTGTTSRYVYVSVRFYSLDDLTVYYRKDSVKKYSYPSLVDDQYQVAYNSAMSEVNMDPAATFETYKSLTVLPVNKRLVQGASDYIAPVTCDALVVPPNHHPYQTSLLDDRYAYGELSQICVDGIKTYESDPVSNAVQLPELLKIMESMPKRKSDLVNPKYWAGVYLMYRYAIKTTMTDAEDMYAGISRYMSRKLSRIASVHGTTSRALLQEYSNQVVTTVYNAKLKYFTQESGPAAVLNRLYQLNLMPRVTTAWDLVPFSFVADWFLHIDDAIAMIDYKPLYATLHTRSMTYSKLTTVSAPIQPNSDCWTPPYGTTTHYSRVVHPSALEPIPQFRPTGISSSNAIAGAALIIGGKK